MGQVKKVDKETENTNAIELIERAIVEISASMKRINATRLSRRALVTLISDDAKLGKGIVETVLNSLEQLEATYLKKKPEGKIG